MPNHNDKKHNNSNHSPLIGLGDKLDSIKVEEFPLLEENTSLGGLDHLDDKLDEDIKVKEYP